MKGFNYIIAGAGCAGLSLLVRLIESGRFADKKILLVDKGPKNVNDRTWCFWEQLPGYFERQVYKKWDSIYFHGPGFSSKFDIAPYQYKMVRGVDFYTHCMSVISSALNVTVTYGEIQDMCGDEGDTWIMLDNKKIKADYIFNSILFQKPLLLKNEFLLLQHFKGWLLETSKPAFDETTATFMDFRPPQRYGTAFVYLMPLSSQKALVEYTLFTPQLLEQSQYEEELKQYLQLHYPGLDYTVTEKEFGVIPMTNKPFPASNGNIIHIGTAGGQTKASSGYTFRFIQKHAELLVDALIRGRSLAGARPSYKKFHWYDSVLLNVLAKERLPGATVFTQLFKKNRPQAIFRFLDNETSLREDIPIISSLPVWPFLKAGIQQW